MTRAFVLVALANLAFCIANAFTIHLPGFLQQLGGREAEIGRILGAQPLAALLAGPSVGRALDRHGRRIVIRAGITLYTVVAAMYLAIDSLGPFVYLVRALEGLSYTMLYAALFTYAADVVPAERRTEGLALFGASGLVPMGLSALLGDAILAHAGYRTLFATALGFALVAWALCWPLSDVHRAAVAAEPSAPASFRELLVRRDFAAIWCVALTFFFAMSAVVSFMKTYVLARGFGSVGAFFAAYAGIALALRVGLGWVPDRVGLRRMVLPATSAYALGALGLAAAEQTWHVLLAGLSCGIGHSYAYPVFYSLVIARARPSERGAAMGLYTTIDWAGMLAAGPLIGLLIEHTSYAVGFGALAATLALGTAAFYAIDPGRGAGRVA